MKFRRALIGALVTLMAAVGAVAVASPASAAPAICNALGFPSGRDVYIDNNDNGGGAFVSANLCWKSNGNGYYDTFVEWTVTDTEANGAGATIRMEWTGTDGDTHYYVPEASQRAWTAWATADGEFARGNIKGLYVRACLTNTNSPGHHCGAKY
ncbi:hypothetical protein AB0A73_05045 [Glycomyces sp. NPDC047369]